MSTAPISRIEHAAIEAGQFQFTRLFARQFFVRTSTAEVEGFVKSFGKRRLLILLSGPVPPLIFVVAMSLLFASPDITNPTVIVPAVGFGWTILYGLTSDRGGWMIGTVSVGICLIIELVMIPMFQGALILSAFSLWLHRAIYLLSESWFRDMLVTSYDAYAANQEHIHILPPLHE